MFERTLNRLLLLVSKVLCNKFFLGIVFEASYCHFLIAYLISFLQTQGPHIFQLAPSSNYFDCKAMAIGARSQVILFRHFSLRRLMFSKAPLSLPQVFQRCSVKEVFLEISQNPQENTCARVSFLIKLQASGRTPPVAASDILFFVRFVISNSAGAPEVSHVPFEERLFTTSCWFLL